MDYRVFEVCRPGCIRRKFCSLQLRIKHLDFTFKFAVLLFHFGDFTRLFHNLHTPCFSLFLHATDCLFMAFDLFFQIKCFFQMPLLIGCMFLLCRFKSSVSFVLILFRIGYLTEQIILQLFVICLHLLVHFRQFLKIGLFH